MLGRSLKVAQRRRWLWLQLAAPKRTRRTRARLWCQDAIADFDSVCICLSVSVFGFFALPRHFSICLPISGSCPSFELAPSQEILHRRFQHREQSDPNPFGYRFSHARRPLCRKPYRVWSKINCFNHRNRRTCCNCRQIGNRWRPQLPQKPKQKLKLLVQCYFLSLSDFGPPIRARQFVGRWKTFPSLSSVNGTAIWQHCINYDGKLVWRTQWGGVWAEGVG